MRQHKPALECEFIGACLAHTLAHEIGLPIGNLWEPGIARQIARELLTAPLWYVERIWRQRLGLRTGGATA